MEEGERFTASAASTLGASIGLANVVAWRVVRVRRSVEY